MPYTKSSKNTSKNRTRQTISSSSGADRKPPTKSVVIHSKEIMEHLSLIISLIALMLSFQTFNRTRTIEETEKANAVERKRQGIRLKMHDLCMRLLALAEIPLLGDERIKSQKDLKALEAKGEIVSLLKDLVSAKQRFVKLEFPKRIPCEAFDIEADLEKLSGDIDETLLVFEKHEQEIKDQDLESILKLIKGMKERILGRKNEGDA